MKNESAMVRLVEDDGLITTSELEEIFQHNHEAPHWETHFLVTHKGSGYLNIAHTLSNKLDANGECLVSYGNIDNDDYRDCYFVKSTVRSAIPTERFYKTEDVLQRIKLIDRDPVNVLLDHATNRKYLPSIAVWKLQEERIALEFLPTENEYKEKLRECIKDGIALFPKSFIDKIIALYPQHNTLPNPKSASEKWGIVESLLQERRRIDQKSKEKPLLKQIYDENPNLHKNFGNRTDKEQTEQNFVVGYRKWKSDVCKNATEKVA